MSTGTGPAAAPGPGQPLNATANGGDGLIKSVTSGRASHVGTNKYPSNSGKNSAGVPSGTPGSNQPENVEGDGGGDGTGPTVRGRTKRALYGFQSRGPARASIPKDDPPPKQDGKAAVRAPDANPDAPPPYESLFGKKLNHLGPQPVQTVGNLTHGRVGKAQKLCTFGSHRRSVNYVDGTKAMLIGPFSDHLKIKHRRQQLTTAHSSGLYG